MAPLVSLSQLPARLPTCVQFTGFRPRKALFKAQIASKMRSAQGLSVQIVCPNCYFSDRFADLTGASRETDPIGAPFVRAGN